MGIPGQRREGWMPTDYTHVWSWRVRPVAPAKPIAPLDDGKVAGDGLAVGDGHYYGSRCRIICARSSMGSAMIEFELDGAVIVTSRRGLKRLDRPAGAKLLARSQAPGRLEAA